MLRGFLSVAYALHGVPLQYPGAVPPWNNCSRGSVSVRLDRISSRCKADCSRYCVSDHHHRRPLHHHPAVLRRLATVPATAAVRARSKLPRKTMPPVLNRGMPKRRPLRSRATRSLHLLLPEPRNRRHLHRRNPQRRRSRRHPITRRCGRSLRRRRRQGPEWRSQPATPMRAEHIANGMRRAGGRLPPVDREFYVMQGEIYTDQPFGQHGSQEFSVEKLLDEYPDHFVFNDSVGALSKLHPLQAKVGQTCASSLAWAGRTSPRHSM